MDNVLSKGSQIVSRMAGRLHCRALQVEAEVSGCPLRSALFRVGFGVGAGCMLVAESAVAGEGIAGMLTTAGQQANQSRTALGQIFAVAGFGVAGVGGYLWYRKGKEGDSTHITAGQVAVPIVAGATLGAIGFVMLRAGETLGINAGAYGQVPGGN